MKKGFIISVIILCVIVTHCQAPVANAGADQDIPHAQGFTVLDGSASTGTGNSYAWRLLSPPSNASIGNIVNPTQSVTGVMILPYNDDPGFNFELTVTNGSGSDKDTVNIFPYWGEWPPQRTTLHYVTAADTLAINAVHGIGFSVISRDLYIDGANDGWDSSGFKTDIYINLPALLTTTPMTPGSKILINAGKYRNIQLQFDVGQVVGATNNKIIITAVFGQVRFQSMIQRNLKHCIITGEYVPLISGIATYPGHKLTYNFNHGTYGLYGSNDWSSLATTTLSIGGDTDSCEWRYMELGNGGFTHVQPADLFSSADMDSLVFSDLLVHDAHSELFYFGPTSGSNPHQFHNLVIKNIRGLRGGGESPQIVQVQSGLRLVNSVWIMSDVNWRSQFHDSQDFGLQISNRNGNNRIEGNIWLGAAEQMVSSIANKKQGVTQNNDTIFFRKNIFKDAKGFIHTYFASQSFQPTARYVIDSNYFGGSRFQANEVFSDARGTNTQDVMRFQMDSAIHLTFKNNKRDNTKTTWINNVGASITYDSSGNTVQTIANPLFQNSGWPDTVHYEKIERWVDTVFRTWKDEGTLGGTHQGNPVSYDSAEVVIFLSKFYESKINSNHGHMPVGVTDAYWRLMTWTKPNDEISYFPPDDYRLREGDPYRALGIGLTDYSSAVPPYINPVMRRRIIIKF